MAIIIRGGVAIGETGVDTDHNLLVNVPTDSDLAGNVCICAEENPDGAGIGRMTRVGDISQDFRLRTGTDTMVFSDTFSHAQLNLSKYRIVNTTATNALVSGAWVLNNGNSVTSGQGTQWQTYATFRTHLSYSTYVEFACKLLVAPQNNTVVEFGLIQCSGVTAPTDGVFFRYTATGELLGVINNNGSEITVSLSAPASPAIGFVVEAAKSYHYLLVVNHDRTEFWIDDVLYGYINTPKTIGAPSLAMSNPLGARFYNSGTVSLAQQLQTSNVAVSYGDNNGNRLWPTTMAVMGNSSVNVPDGTAAGQTANYANSAVAADASLSNTAAGYATLGGQFTFVAPAGAETDFNLFAYLNPAGTATVPGKNLVIRGVRIDSVNVGAAVATTATILQWGLATGATAITQVTADSATAGTRAGRRIVLGMQSFIVGAAIGAQGQTVDTNLDAPLVVEPGTYFIVLVKVPVGTATASQKIRGTVMVNGYFE
jgi:hypothetical protein